MWHEERLIFLPYRKQNQSCILFLFLRDGIYPFDRNKNKRARSGPCVAPCASAQSVCQAETAVISYWYSAAERRWEPLWRDELGGAGAAREASPRALNIMKHFTHVKTCVKCHTCHTQTPFYTMALLPVKAKEFPSILISQLEVEKIQLFWDWSPPLYWWGLTKVNFHFSFLL